MGRRSLEVGCNEEKKAWNDAELIIDKRRTVTAAAGSAERSRQLGKLTGNNAACCKLR